MSEPEKDMKEGMDEEERLSLKIVDPNSQYSGLNWSDPMYQRATGFLAGLALGRNEAKDCSLCKETESQYEKERARSLRLAKVLEQCGPPHITGSSECAHCDRMEVLNDYYASSKGETQASDKEGGNHD